jgi:hypothetical protein
MMTRLTSIVSKTSASTSTVSSLPGWGGSGETLSDLSWLGGADRGTREAEGFVRDEKQQMVASRDRRSVSRFSVIQLVQRALAQSRRRREHAPLAPITHTTSVGSPVAISVCPAADRPTAVHIAPRVVRVHGAVVRSGLWGTLDERCGPFCDIAHDAS